MMPGSTGGANWEGGAFDPETGVLYVASKTQPVTLALVIRPERSDMNFVQGRGDGSPPSTSTPETTSGYRPTARRESESGTTRPWRASRPAGGVRKREPASWSPRRSCWRVKSTAAILISVGGGGEAAQLIAMTLP